MSDPVPRWTPPAIEDLTAIVLYVGTTAGNPAAAERISDGFFDKAEQYARQPLMGTLIEDLGPDLRVFRQGRHIAVYCPAPYDIDVLRVFDATRDYVSLFHAS